jgi:hypothetical protein
MLLKHLASTLLYNNITSGSRYHTWLSCDKGKLSRSLAFLEGGCAGSVICLHGFANFWPWVHMVMVSRVATLLPLVAGVLSMLRNRIVVISADNDLITVSFRAGSFLPEGSGDDYGPFPTFALDRAIARCSPT